MDILIAIVAFAVLFGLFAASRVAERTRPCTGRENSGEGRCGTCPLRSADGGEVGACPGLGSPDEGG